MEIHGNLPDGTNINEGCGATHPEYISKLVEGRIGICFDGDADRLIAVDEDGVPANGDVVMAIIARYLKSQGKLRNDLVVGTVMANLGFRRAMEDLGIELVRTKVGDRYVLEAMKERKAALGGEQSGHVIFLDTAPTGDGLLTAVRLLEVVAATGKDLRTLRAEAITEFPQVLRNVRVPDASKLEGAESLWAAVERAERQLGDEGRHVVDGAAHLPVPDVLDEGRILVRASGTEPLVRVMVEAATRQTANDIAEELSTIVRNELA